MTTRPFAPSYETAFGRGLWLIVALSGWLIGGFNRLFTSSSTPPPKRTVQAGRRRPTGQQTGPRERAEAPQREQPQGGQVPPPRPPSMPPTTGGGYSPRPSGGFGPSLGGGGGRGPSPLLLIGGLIALVVCGLPGLLLFTGVLGGGNSGQTTVQLPDTSGVFQDQGSFGNLQQAQPAGPVATVPLPQAASGSGTKWTIMLYQDADDKILEQDIFVDVNEAERIGSTENVNILAQLDRYRGGYQGDGNWTGSRRYYVTRDNNLSRIGSPVVQDLGEVDMSDEQTLYDFVTWGIKNYPADKYVLILSDHGMGWPGGWSDGDSGGVGQAGVPLARALGGQIYLNELDDVLTRIRQDTGLQAFELIGMDACLMSHAEVYAALAPHARYSVASQETEPAVGWAYTAFLQQLAANPNGSGAELGTVIVDTYIDEDQRIVDDQARAEFVGRGPSSSLYGNAQARAVAQQMSSASTLAAIDLSAMPALVESINNLAYQLQGVNQSAVAQARTYAQSYTNIWGGGTPPSYIDLGHFVQLLQQTVRDPNVMAAGDQVLAAIEQAVITSKNGPKKRGSNGISIYFPNSQLYSSAMSGPPSYVKVAERFAEVSLWDDFLGYHYTGRQFRPDAAELVVPEAASRVEAPGAGTIDISEIRLSDDVAAPGQPVLLSGDVSGDNIGYIYFFAGFLDEASNSIFIADRDYLTSAEQREVDGVFYPDWGEGAFTVEFEWEPLMFAISDGQTRATVALEPQSYGESAEQAVYTVDGTYTYVDRESRRARLYFQNGVLTQVFGFTGDDATGAPREIIPSPGDQFTPLETWMDLGPDGQSVTYATQNADTLTFGDQMFTWEVLDAAVGQYVVGLIVEDMDGNQDASYAQVNVE